MIRKKGLLIALVVILSLGMAGVTIAADPIKVGTLMALTGPGAAFGTNMLFGLQMAIDDINAGGGLLGRKIEIISIDDAAQPAHVVGVFHDPPEDVPVRLALLVIFRLKELQRRLLAINVYKPVGFDPLDLRSG